MTNTVLQRDIYCITVLHHKLLLYCVKITALMHGNYCIKNYCITASQLPHYCITITALIRDNYCITASQLPHYCYKSLLLLYSISFVELPKLTSIFKLLQISFYTLLQIQTHNLSHLYLPTTAQEQHSQLYQTAASREMPFKRSTSLFYRYIILPSVNRSSIETSNLGQLEGNKQSHVIHSLI